MLGSFGDFNIHSFHNKLIASGEGGMVTTNNKKLAKKFDYEYWDGDRRICYGGYNYILGRWEKVAKRIAEHYFLPLKSIAQH